MEIVALSYVGGVLLFILAASEITLNEPVFVDFSVHNRLSERIRFDLGHNRKSNFELVITRPDGSVIRAPKLSEEGLGLIGRITLTPDEEYTQRIIVNEWYQFGEPGDYVIEIKLANPLTAESGAIVDPGPSSALHLHISSRKPEKLEQICEALYHKAVSSTSVEEASEATFALSYVRDPIAVPYLEKGLKEGRLSWQYVIPGLARIANVEAIDALIYVLKIKDAESGSALARFVLNEVREKIQDSNLQEKIGSALNSD